MSEHFLRLDRRRFIEAAAGTAVAGMSLSALSVLGTSSASAATTTSTPRYGAGVFNVDPDQGRLSQSPSVIVTGNVRVLPFDLAF